MKPEVRNFIESLKPDFEYLRIENQQAVGTYVNLPYLGKTLIDDSMTNFELIRLLVDAGYDNGKRIGKQELANELKHLLQIPNDYE